MLPTAMRSDKPLRPLMASPGVPHSGARRGNSMNSSTMMGAPSSAVLPAMRAACHSEGRPTGMWLLTKAVSKPHSPINMAPAVSRDCE